MALCISIWTGSRASLPKQEEKRSGTFGTWGLSRSSVVRNGGNLELRKSGKEEKKALPQNLAVPCDPMVNITLLCCRGHLSFSIDWSLTFENEDDDEDDDEDEDEDDSFTSPGNLKRDNHPA